MAQRVVRRSIGASRATATVIVVCIVDNRFCVMMLVLYLLKRKPEEVMLVR